MKYYLLKEVTFERKEPLTQSEINRIVNKDIDKLSTIEFCSTYGLDIYEQSGAFYPENADLTEFQVFDPNI